MYYWNSLSIYFPLLKYEFIKFNMLLWNIFDFFFFIVVKKKAALCWKNAQLEDYRVSLHLNEVGVEGY